MLPLSIYTLLPAACKFSPLVERVFSDSLTCACSFVGPIPVGWLKNHRSEWYKHHLHVFYSSKEAGFAKEDNVGFKRRVTGLEPPPVQQEEDAETPLLLRGEAVENSGPVPIPRAGLVVGSKIDGKLKGKVKSPEGLSPPERHPGKPFMRGSRRNTEPRSFTRGESFATASEGLSSGDELGDDEQEEEEEEEGEGEGKEEEVGPLRSGESSRPGPSRAHTAPARSNTTPPNTAPLRIGMGLSRSHTGYFEGMTTAEPIPITRSDSEGSAAGSVPPSVEASNSLASLLKHDELARRKKLKSSESRGRPPLVQRASLRPSILSMSRKKSSSPRKKDYTESEPTVKISTSAPQRTSTNRDRVSGGLVRFNTAVDMRERDKLMQLKLADMSRSRTFRHGGRHYPHGRKREGEIIKMENMLVRVETTMKHVPNDYDENESTKIETRTAEKWREYVVVCRETGEPETPFSLRLYKSRVIPAIDRPHVSSHGTREIPLNPKTTGVNLYSSLDKTLVIWLPWRKGNIIYIMRPRCYSSSVEWYTFLRNALGWAKPDMLQIHVPNLSLSLRIENPFEKIEEKLRAEDYDDEAPLREEKVVAKNLLDKSMSMLEGVKEWADIVDYWKRDERMGLAWRRYDRLEWIHGVWSSLCRVFLVADSWGRLMSNVCTVRLRCRGPINWSYDPRRITRLLLKWKTGRKWSSRRQWKGFCFD